MKCNGLGKELYKKMYMIRASEMMICQEYKNNEMKTPMHMSMGEEAIVVGILHAIKNKQVLCSPRSHAAYLACTGNLDNFFAEMYGKETAILKGIGGSMHLCDPDRGFLGSSGIVASQIPVAVGAAYANKIKKNGKTVVVFFGDGATEEGVFWESINIACLMRLPIIFVCEDNNLAVHTPKSKRQAYRCVSDIVHKFGGYIDKFDTTDVELIYKWVRRTWETLSRKQQPYFIRATYHRYLEHVGVNTDYEEEYRFTEDFQYWRSIDPVTNMREKLISTNCTPKEIEVLENKIDSDILRCVKKAKEAKFYANGKLLRCYQ